MIQNIPDDLLILRMMLACHFLEISDAGFFQVDGHPRVLFPEHELLRRRKKVFNDLELHRFVFILGSHSKTIDIKLKGQVHRSATNH